MKAKFSINDPVQTGTTSGIVREIAVFADHVEYFVACKNGSGAWFHEEKVSAAAKSSTLNSPTRN